MEKFDEKMISMINNPILDENYWLSQLGVGLSYSDLNDENAVNFPFFQKGRAYWDKIQQRLRDAICEDGEPIQEIKDAFASDESKISEVVLTFVFGLIDPIGTLAIPVTALLLKRGISDYCK